VTVLWDYELNFNCTCSNCDYQATALATIRVGC